MRPPGDGGSNHSSAGEGMRGEWCGLLGGALLFHDLSDDQPSSMGHTVPEAWASSTLVLSH